MTGCVLESVAQGSQAKAILLSLVSLVDPEHIYCPRSALFAHCLPKKVEIMVPVTRNTDPLEHLLSTVFNAADPDHRMRLALSAASCQSIVDVVDLSKEDLKSIEWLNSAKEVQKLRIVEINSLLAVSSWFATQSIKDESVFLTLTPDILSSH